MGKRTGRETGANTVRGHATAGPVEHGGSTVKDALDRIEQRQEDQGKVLVSMGDRIAAVEDQVTRPPC